MPLTRCPKCRTPLSDPAVHDCPACGQDLAWVRAELARLASPSCTWEDRPYGHPPVDAATRRASDRLLDATARRMQIEADRRRGRVLSFTSQGDGRVAGRRHGTDY